MNPDYFGDSYDLVKRFFCRELYVLGYSVEVDAMLTGAWSGTESSFYRLVGAGAYNETPTEGRPRALLVDPDTGVRKSAGPRHVSFAHIAEHAKTLRLVFAFDQSFSRQGKASVLIQEKLGELQALGCSAMYYDSHARFVFASAEEGPIHELRAHLLSLGLPQRRLVESVPSHSLQPTHVVPPQFFENAAHFRAWLEENHAAVAELHVGFHKVGSGLPSMTWPESVDEALCYGWIDGVRKRIDDTSYFIRFSQRRKESMWSLVNLAKVKELTALGRMRPPGVAAYEARSAKKTGVYSFEQQQPVALMPAELREFKKNKAAWKYFESSAPSYRKIITYWVVSAKQQATRARRLAQLIEACAESKRLLK